MADISGSLKHHLPYLRRYARALTGTQASGDGFVEAALTHLLGQRDQLSDPDSMRITLFRSLHDVWSRPADDVADLAEASPMPNGAVSDGSSEIFLLSLLEGFSINEIAQILDMSVEEARQRYEDAIAEVSKVATSEVLIIEDEPVIAMELARIVEDLGHKVKGTAATHDGALDLSANDLPELILADIRLADGSSGLDAVKDLTASADIPTIFITAYPEEFLTGEKPEPAFLISKPFRPDQIRATVSQCLFVQMHRSKGEG